jgi:hypothetical protein
MSAAREQRLSGALTNTQIPNDLPFNSRSICFLLSEPANLPFFCCFVMKDTVQSEKEGEVQQGC